jgi:hypothetical protein
MGLGSGIREKPTYSGSRSRGQKGTGSRIRNTGENISYFANTKGVSTSTLEHCYYDVFLDSDRGDRLKKVILVILRNLCKTRFSKF